MQGGGAGDVLLLSLGAGEETAARIACRGEDQAAHVFAEALRRRQRRFIGDLDGRRRVAVAWQRQRFVGLDEPGASHSSPNCLGEFHPAARVGAVAALANDRDRFGGHGFQPAAHVRPCPRAARHSRSRTSMRAKPSRFRPRHARVGATSSLVAARPTPQIRSYGLASTTWTLLRWPPLAQASAADRAVRLGSVAPERQHFGEVAGHVSGSRS